MKQHVLIGWKNCHHLNPVNPIRIFFLSVLHWTLCIWIDFFSFSTFKKQPNAQLFMAKCASHQNLAAGRSPSGHQTCEAHLGFKHTSTNTQIKSFAWFYQTCGCVCISGFIWKTIAGKVTVQVCSTHYNQQLSEGCWSLATSSCRNINIQPPAVPLNVFSRGVKTPFRCWFTVI